MKRSEMVAILENTINSQLYQDHQFDTYDVSEMLAALEKAGMLPPTTNADLYNPSSVHEWEPEND